ncbi:hypothetical protein DV515_00011537, partial [Chloebia gouldiae]
RRGSGPGAGTRSRGGAGQGPRAAPRCPTPARHAGKPGAAGPSLGIAGRDRQGTGVGKGGSVVLGVHRHAAKLSRLGQGCFCGSPGAGRSRGGTCPEPGLCSLPALQAHVGLGTEITFLLINNEVGTGRNKVASAPLALPREAGSCVSSALRLPAGSHSPSPGITETLLLAPGVAQGRGGKGAVPGMTSGARKGRRVSIATRMLWVFGE